jgi:hypothetical protein
MNVSRSGLGVLVAALLLVSAASARANEVADGTYTFTATDGNTFLDGSWVQFSGDEIVSWDLVDSSAAGEYGWLASFSGYGYPSLFPPLTPGNSAVITSLTYLGGTGPDPFSFTIGSPGAPDGPTSAASSIFYFEGQNNLSGSSALYDSATFNPVITDPEGIWLPSLAVSAAPDAFGTLALLAGGLTALAVGASAIPRPAPARI